MSAFSQITKYDQYNERMSRGMLDKIFFVDKVDAHAFVDFGCADGTLFKYMRLYLPEALFVGYDSDKEMCEKAQTSCNDKESRGYTAVYNHWADVVNEIQRAKGNKQKTCLILSSVVHEVYHYSTPEAIDEFWKNVFDTGFDTIVLRDMIPSESVDRQADIADVAKVLHKYRETKELKDFERRWGSIQGNKNLLHFLLKFKYTTPNWEREVKENYLPLYWEDLMAMLPPTYDVLYHEHYALPFLKRSIRQEFGIELKDATHLKLILEKR